MLIAKSQKTFFQRELFQWDRALNLRTMPWKGEKDAYRIWLSEIILQQTRVEQGLPYYERFISRYPNVIALATAKDEEVYKLWEGLGYYSRCANLLTAARSIVQMHGGKFPDNYESIRSLKGVGDYTAAAISSFAYDLPHAVVDGNVSRVLSRFFGLATEINSSAGKNLFSSVATQLLDTRKPGKYNQAIMDFGATVCKPSNPLCKECCLQERCVAFKKELVELLPVKIKAAPKVTRQFCYYILEFEGNYYVRKRIGKDIWRNLYEFVLWEKSSDDGTGPTEDSVLKQLDLEPNGQVLEISPMRQQVLSHQVLQARFVRVKLTKPLNLPSDYNLISSSQLAVLPFPKLIRSYLKDRNESLNLL
jgi:A/G-specific adenine glycosylase